MKKLISLLFLFLILLSSAQAIEIKETWKREGNTIFSENNVNNIDCIVLGNGQVRAYYMKGGSIQSSLSSDDGLTFVDEGTRVSGNHFAVVKIDSTQVRMYYTDGDTGDLFSAISDDGLTFTEEEGVRISSSEAMVVHPSVVILPDGTYKMYFDIVADNGVGFGEQILSATSTDGLNWFLDSGTRITPSKKGLPKKSELTFSPLIKYDTDNNVYKLYFTVENNKPKKSGLFLATSTDGLSFKVLKDAVLGVNPAIKKPIGIVGGLKGNPQDAFIFTKSNGAERMYIWESQQSYISASLKKRKIKR